MSFNKDYNQFYNLTLGVIQNIYTNMFTSVLDIDFQLDTMLYDNLIHYEKYLFEFSIHLLKFSIYYMCILVCFECVSTFFDILSIHSSVTRRYIREYNELLKKYKTGYLTDCDTIHELIKEKEQQSNKISELKNEISELKKKTNNKFLQDKNTQSNPTPYVPLKKKVNRKAAKKASKTIEQLVNEKLI
jgi:hypothetical protein